MQRYTTYLRLEWRLFAAEPGTWIVLSFMLLSAIGAIANGVSNVRMQNRFVAEAREGQKQKYEDLALTIQSEERKTAGPINRVTAWTPRFAPAAREAVYNFKAVLPPPPLAALGFGQTDLYSQSFSIVNNSDDRPILPTAGTRVLSNVVPQHKTESRLRLWIGKWDLVFVVTYLYPLLIIALSHDLIANDRVTGTLSLALAQGISLRSLVTARLLIRAISIFVAGVAVPTVVLLIAHSLSGLPADPARVILWMLAATGYMLCWLAATLVVNVTGWSVARNTVTLVSLWTLMVLLVPACVGFLVRMLAPVMANTNFVDAERVARNEANERTAAAYDAMIDAFNRNFPIAIDAPASEKQQRELRRYTDPIHRPVGNEVLDSFYTAHPEYSKNLTHFQLWYAAQVGRDFLTEKRLAPILMSWREQRASQDRLARWLMYLSPSMLIHASLVEIAGAGEGRYQDFLVQLDSYIRNREAWFTNKIAKLEPISSTDLRSQPLFQVRPEAAIEVACRVAFSIAVLWFVGLAILFSIRLRLKQYSILSD